MIKRKYCLVIFILISAICVTSIHATGFEDMTGVAVGPGINVPIGEWKGLFESGQCGSLSYYSVLPFRSIIEFSCGLEVPTTNIQHYSFIGVPVSVNLLFPFSIENASTPYVSIGPSVSMNISHLRDVTTDTKIRTGYNFQLGYLIAPEHWQYTFIDLKIMYSQFFIFDSDIRNLNLLLRIGLKM